MKKLLCAALMVCLMLCGTMGAGMAEADAGEYTDVPSVMTQDSVRRFTAEPGGRVELLQPYPDSVALLEKLYDFVWKQQNRPVRFYDEETQRQIQALVPEIDIDSLYMTEFMGLHLSAGDAQAERMTMCVTLEPDYVPGQLIVAVLGIQQADGIWAWSPYRGEVPETGVIRWEMPAEDFAVLTQDRSVLHILTIRPGGMGLDASTARQPENTARPSKQAGDLTKVDEWESTSGEPIEDTFRIFFVALTERMNAELLQLSAFIEEGHAPIEWFPEEIQAQAREMKQNGAAVDAMVIYDVAAVMDEDYRDTYGDVATKNSFPTSYRADKEMFALLGFWTEEEQFEWYYLRANGLEDGDGAEIVYKQLVLPTMEEKPAMLIVFSEPLIEDETEG